ncbi:uncharacterized protein LACBIDRAFT_291440 [Laccaria bicolor S238N-H82]|uniref:Predicted protein n=1 Tax=Laccaria bicolor (strain S238N-H82 / ATCC MYA-4686) TaxID=486041 RepID=B0CPG3_LACBS|nr:uncharacterized protein LACBIDRAFT_291440 [Laccaria bicolor S238N-H82]EDR15565.1 predicted protein [Laccaria bicolor S238N-H82]|eukprot:XP_001873773.1 predicted protein [Laccaria bicolor S238N-H82]
MPSTWSYFSCVALALSASTRAEAFTFTFSTPSQCQNIAVTWTGGQPPFQLLIIPPSGTIRTFSIPSSAYQGNSGSFSTPLLFGQNQRLMLSMSDATGAASGGISDLLTVGPPQGASQCNTTDPGVDFFFSLDGVLQQCQPYPFTQYGGAIQPITITAYVPLGNSFVLNPPTGSSFSWIANLPAGTSVAFSMIDSQGRNGGTSPIEVVGLTNNNSCLATTVVTSSRSGVTSSRTTSTSQTSKSNSGQDNNGTSQGGSKIGIIIGAAVGGFALVGIAAFLFFCFSRNRRAKPGYRPNQKVDFTYDPVRPPSPDPFILPAGYTSAALAPQVSQHHNSAPVSPFLSTTTSQHASTAIPLAPQFGRANSPPQFDSSNAPLQFHDPNAPQRFGTPNASQQQFSPNAPQQFGTPNTHQQYGAPNVPQQYGAFNTPQQYGAAISMPSHHNASNTLGLNPNTHQRLGSHNPQQFGGTNTNPQFAGFQDPAQYGAPSTASTYPPQAPQDGRPTSSFSTYSSVYGGMADHTEDTTVRSESQATSSSTGKTGKTHQPRVILHTDIEETMEPEELPPQYSESRAPIPGLSASNDAGLSAAPATSRIVVTGKGRNV